ncbi:unnamed protein product, partial [Rotaria sordida]
LTSTEIQLISMEIFNSLFRSNIQQFISIGILNNLIQ